MGLPLLVKRGNLFTLCLLGADNVDVMRTRENREFRGDFRFGEFHANYNEEKTGEFSKTQAKAEPDADATGTMAGAMKGSRC